MNRVSRIRSAVQWPLLLLFCLNVRASPVDPPKTGGAVHATRQALIGAWQLQSIQLVGANGPMTDPFYNDGSTGLLIYDPSGWMSVQIVGRDRAAVETPALRPSHNSAADEERRRAAQLDSYYAYFATWEFDAATSTVTHHVVSSLFPDESGMSYSQAVSLDGEFLVFTTRRQLEGATVVQKKIWRRIIPGDGSR